MRAAPEAAGPALSQVIGPFSAVATRMAAMAGGCAVVLGPYLVGVVDGSAWFYALYFAAELAPFAYIAITGKVGAGAGRLALVVASCCLAVTTADLFSRFALRGTIYYRPHEMFVVDPWPPVPSLIRYARNVSYKGPASGDAAAISGLRRHREPRVVVFETDDFGFRNDRAAAEATIDVVVLGDSFGEGSGTSQEKTWVSQLQQKTGLRTYNLSLTGSPWEQLLNLKLEFDRLETRPGATLLWMLFSGNDLDDFYGPGLEPPEPTGGMEQALLTLDRFRRRSPLRQLWWRFSEGSDPKRAAQTVVVRNGPDGRAILFLRHYAIRRNLGLEDVRRQPNFEKLKQIFAEVGAFAEERGIGVAVVAAPTKAEVYSWMLDGGPPWTSFGPSGFSLAIRRLSRRNDFRFLDLKPPLIEESRRVFEERGELLWWTDDTHWNEAGQEVVASLIQRAVFGQRLDAGLRHTRSRSKDPR